MASQAVVFVVVVVLTLPLILERSDGAKRTSEVLIDIVLAKGLVVAEYRTTALEYATMVTVFHMRQEACHVLKRQYDGLRAAYKASFMVALDMHPPIHQIIK